MIWRLPAAVREIGAIEKLSKNASIQPTEPGRVWLGLSWGDKFYGTLSSSYSFCCVVGCSEGKLNSVVDSEDVEFEDAGPDQDLLCDFGPEVEPMREDLIGPAYELWTHEALVERDVTHGRFIEPSVTPSLPSILSSVLITQDSSEERVEP